MTPSLKKKDTAYSNNTIRKPYIDLKCLKFHMTAIKD